MSDPVVDEAIAAWEREELDPYISAWKAAILKHVKRFESKNPPGGASVRVFPKSYGEPKDGEGLQFAKLVHHATAQSETRIKSKIGTFLAGLAIKMALAVRRHAGSVDAEKASKPPKKPAKPTAAELTQQLNAIGDWGSLAENLRDDLALVAQAAGVRGLLKIGITEADMVAAVNESAGEWAYERAAELVGKKWVNDVLVDNPDAKWNITDYTRDRVRSIVEDAFYKETSMTTLADEIEQSGPFSSGRAAMIARTEVLRAENEGAMKGWQESGIVSQVDWTLSADHDDASACDCSDIFDGSPYDIDEVPDCPVHPQCLCGLIPVVDPASKVAKYSPDQPRDDHGMWTDGGGSVTVQGDATQQAYQFYSPNVAENMTFTEAAGNLSSADQARAMLISQDVDKQVGLEAYPKNAIGDWKDGAENTILNEIHNDGNYEAVRYSAAVKGELMNQKAVIPFVTDVNGADSLYRFSMKGTLGEIRTALDSGNVDFRTLVPSKQSGTQVYVFDPGTKLTASIEKLAETHDLKISQFTGRGEFLGGDTRAEGRQAYAKVRAQYEKSNPRYYQQPPGPGVPVAGNP